MESVIDKPVIENPVIQILGLSLMDRGMIPLGGLLLGAVSELAGPRASYALMGLGCLLTVLVFLARTRGRGEG